MAHKTDEEILQTTHNLPRFCIENRQIAWVILIATVVWGVVGYTGMPQRKDPDIPVRQALVVVSWPGASAEKVEQLVIKPIEEAVAQNAEVDKIESISRSGLALVYVSLDEYSNTDAGKAFDDVKGKLDEVRGLPQGAGPIQFVKDFGDTAALMLTVASPKVSAAEIALRAQGIQRAIVEARRAGGSANSAEQVSLVFCFPPVVSRELVEPPFRLLLRHFEERRLADHLRVVFQPGFLIMDGRSSRSDATLLAEAQRFLQGRLQLSSLHPDAWDPVMVRGPNTTQAQLAAVAGDKYSYRELDDFTHTIERTIKTVSSVSKTNRAGILPETIYLMYSQERLAAYGLQPSAVSSILGARNITAPGGRLEVQGRSLDIDPSGEFKSEKEIGDVALDAAPNGSPVYLRELAQVLRSYQDPPAYLNYFQQRDAQGRWHRTRAITLAIQMRAGNKIGDFGKAVDAALQDVRSRLPADLIYARTSDQPLQVAENVGLFMQSLFEAIVLVVVVACIGFWDWRSALLMACSIPLTLTMTFGMMAALGLDIQQVSVATLIIALGLLVDNPVVAGDGIKRGLAQGLPRSFAAWLGPTKLATALTYATITNVVAYLPFLLLKGDTGRFIYSLPIVMTCALASSLIVANTFIPLIGYYLLRGVQEPSLAERRQKGFPALYYRVGGWCIRHRRGVLAGSLLFLALGGFVFTHMKQAFFPKDLQYLSYIDIWLPEDAPVSATNQAAIRAEQVIRKVTEDYDREHPVKERSAATLASLTTFVGGGSPRFWFSLVPEQQQRNYAMVIVQVNDKHATTHLGGLLQRALSAEVPGARIDVRQLETGKPVGIPVGVRLSGEDPETLQALAEQVKAIYRGCPYTARIRDDWGDAGFHLDLLTDPDRANLAGVSNSDVAGSTAAGVSGQSLSVLRQADKQIPIVARLRPEERARVQDMGNLYVYSARGDQHLPIGQVAQIRPEMLRVKQHRRNQFRTITISCFPTTGRLPYEIVKAVQPQM
ncbi:MAG: AcrB/AcrD/AcrF family protein, partial [Chthonomonadaceae bacterium]|nr:AcrB/AcrD/AcrF family protein [Chthonomonadaceae bacterium]